MQIEIKRDLCISAATCVAIAPDVFQLDAESKVYLVDPTAAAETTIIEAAKSCPTQAIIIKDDQGKAIYPA